VYNYRNSLVFSLFGSQYADVVILDSIKGDDVGTYKVISLPEGLYILKFRHKKDKTIRLIVIRKKL